MPNNILGNFPHNHSEVGKVTLDYVDRKFHRESGDSGEPESIHEIWESRDRLHGHDLG